ncbi:MAG TPA: caspase family protein [Oculatellaceae cyanobacterium]|jgi:hypothetical protein
MLKRRQFLQFAGSTLATLGISQLDLKLQGDNAHRALAQSSGKKLALLVGINNYPLGGKLKGCHTDIELQKNLLIHRYGFKSKNILILKDEQATRKGIITAFEKHLINKAKPGDVVVFHFSGHGSQVYDADCDFQDSKSNCVNSTLVPFDNNLSLSDRTANGGVVNDIMGHTLFLLMSALKTENVTVVLDSCHSGGGKRGNLTIRSLNGGKQVKPSSEEIEYQQQWLKELNLTPEEFKQKRRQGVPKGVVIAAAKRDQLASDAPFTDFSAGAFTYALTQYLWQQPGNESLDSALINISRTATEIAQRDGTDQNPEWEDKPGSNVSKQPIYFVNKIKPPAEAVVTKIKGERAELWLGGINSHSLESLNEVTIFSIINERGESIGQVNLEPKSRQGLTAWGKLRNAEKPHFLGTGTLLQEVIKPIPKDFHLKIGLDISLGNEQIPAEKALNALKRVQAFPLQQEKEVNYIFGKITADNLEFQLENSLKPDMGSLGLFTSTLTAIPNSFGNTNESITEAVIRLQPKLKSLLAVQLLKTILNPSSSRLNVTAKMIPGDGEDIPVNSFPVRGRRTKQQSSPSVSKVLSHQLHLPVGTPLKFQVTNGENRDLYVAILVIDASGEMSIIFPDNWNAIKKDTLLPAGKTLEIPQLDTDDYQLEVSPPLGRVEVLVIASSNPLEKTLLTLRSIAEPEKVRGRGTRDIIEDIDNDFSKISSDTNMSLGKNVAVVNVQELAAMSISFEAVEKR